MKYYIVEGRSRVGNPGLGLPPNDKRYPLLRRKAFTRKEGEGAIKELELGFAIHREDLHLSECPEGTIRDKHGKAVFPPSSVATVADALSLEDEYMKLKELARLAPEPTAEQREFQRFDFAYGNLACSTNHKPSREAFRNLALERGWSKDQFEKWAEEREWLP